MKMEALSQALWLAWLWLLNSTVKGRGRENAERQNAESTRRQWGDPCWEINEWISLLARVIFNIFISFTGLFTVNIFSSVFRFCSSLTHTHWFPLFISSPSCSVLFSEFHTLLAAGSSGKLASWPTTLFCTSMEKNTYSKVCTHDLKTMEQFSVILTLLWIYGLILD